MKSAFITHASNSPSTDLQYFENPFKHLKDSELIHSFENGTFQPIQYGTVEISEKEECLLFSVPLTPNQIMSLPPRLVHSRICETIQMAQSHGAELIGLGALNSSITFGGRAISNKFDNLSLTNGNTYTALNIFKTLEKIIGGDDSKKIAVLGATGSVGRRLVKLLEVNKFRNITLFGRNKANLEKTSSIFNSETELSKVTEYDIIILLTGTNEIVLSIENLKKNAIIIDATIPSNLDVAGLSSRKDINILTGGLVSTKNIQISGNIGIQQGKMYSCLAETILLGLSNYKGHFALNEASFEDFQFINHLVNGFKELDLQVSI